MKRFCLRVTVFLLLQALAFRWFVWDSNFPREDNYLAALIDKHKRLQASRPPRIILVGGCNLAFGVRSDQLEAALGRRVVNMGLLAGGGLDFMLNNVVGAVREGDVVVLSLEYQLFSEQGNLLHLMQMLEYRPAGFWAVPRQRWKRLLEESGLPILGNVVRRSLGFPPEARPADPTDPHYSRQRFNRWGDYTGHYAQTENLSVHPPESPVWRPAMLQPMSSKQRTQLERFVEHCHRQGARILYTCPPRPPEALQQQGRVIESILSNLKDIPNLEVIDTPAEQVYEHALFIDTPYHLTGAGSRERTARLLARLKSLLAADRGPGG